MDWKWLYLSFDGRIGRKQFWIGVVLLAVAGFVVSFIVMTVFGVSIMSIIAMANTTPSPDEIMAVRSRSAWANLLTYLILAYPAAAMMVKRRHDRAGSGLDIWIYMGLAILLILIEAFGLAYSATDLGNGRFMATPAIWYSVASGLIGVFALYLFIVLGFLKGTQGENAYGPDPTAY